MTIEEAINELRYPLKRRNDPESRNAFLDAVEMAIDSLRAQQEAEKNEPLTLEEIIEMEGEPVWYVDNCGASGWCLVDIHYGAINVCGDWLEGNQYGEEGPDGWISYRRPPKEAHNV